VSIFEAQERDHNADEDRLTSAVFGTLEILDRSKFLASILKKCRIELGEQTDLNNLKFHYWLPTGKRIPDVVLREKSGNRIRIAIECKLDDRDFDVDQLVEEYEDRPDCLVAVSDHWSEPPEIQQARDRLKKPRLHWISWREIYALLHQNKEKGNATEQKLIDDLLLLMERKGLRMFDRFEDEHLNKAIALAQKLPGFQVFLSQCLIFFKTLESALRAKGMTVGKKPTLFEMSHKGIRDWFGIDAWSKTWKDQADNQYFFAHFHLDIDDSQPLLELIAGYHVDFTDKKKGSDLREAFTTRAKEVNLSKGLKQSGYSVMFWQDEGEKSLLLNLASGDKLNRHTFSPKSDEHSSLTLGRRFDLQQIASPRLLHDVVECIAGVRDMVQKNGLYFACYATK
jgi:hypothetical protein